jgi:hypothetical protein
MAAESWSVPMIVIWVKRGRADGSVRAIIELPKKDAPPYPSSNVRVRSFGIFAAVIGMQSSDTEGTYWIALYHRLCASDLAFRHCRISP